MTTCVNPTNTTPNTYPTGGFTPSPAFFTGTPGYQGATPQPFTGYVNPYYPTGFNNTQTPTNQWQTNAPTYGAQPFTNGFNPAFLSVPANTTPWPNPYAFNPYAFAPAAFNPAPWMNPFGTAQVWNNTPQGAFGSPYTAAPTNWNPAFQNAWNTTPFNGWTNPFVTPFNGGQNQWNSTFNPAPFGYAGSPFVGNYSTTPAFNGFVNPVTSGWNTIAATLAAISQPTSWVAQSPSPFVTPNPTGFNTALWAGGFPTFGTGSTTPAANWTPFTAPTTPYAFTPAFFNGYTTPWTNTAPFPGFNPFAAYPTANPWNTQPAFGGFSTQGSPAYTPGFAPTTPAHGIQATRPGPQNGDGSYRNAA
jgi:hypothetical protein